jgi:hypothetical protein
VTKIIKVFVTNLETLKAVFKHKLQFNKLASGAAAALDVTEFITHILMNLITLCFAA